MTDLSPPDAPADTDGLDEGVDMDHWTETRIELQAMQDMLDTLSGLDPSARYRVLQWAASRCGYEIA